MRKKETKLKKKKEPIHYGDFGDLDDDTLVTMRKELMDFLEKNKTKFYIHKFHELIAVERELTLREEDPY